eukprot:2642081-Rhodomonas_salina.1
MEYGYQGTGLDLDGEVYGSYDNTPGLPKPKAFSVQTSVSAYASASSGTLARIAVLVLWCRRLAYSGTQRRV